MIRHSSSFIISLVFHTALFSVLFFSLKNIIHETKKEEVVCVKLCNVVYEEKIEKKPTPETVPHVEPEITPQKIEKKVTPKAKVAPKRAETIKTVPLVQETPKEEMQEKTITQELKMVEQTPTPSSEKSKEQITKRVEQDYLQEHLQKIVTLLQENLYYPRSARERGVEGEVVVKFMITQTGNVSGIEVLSSKSEMLSNAAIKTIENLSGSFPKPKENLHLQLPISYSLK